MKNLKLISLFFVAFANISVISGMGMQEDLSAEIAKIEVACQKAKETKKSEEKENKEKEENKKLIKAINHGNIIEVQNAIKNGANVNAPDTSAGAKWTPLMTAAFRGNFPIAKLLIESGADVNASNAYGDTPLYLAANTSFELAKLLLEKGANVNGSYSNNLTPLMRASIDGKIETVKLLLANGADPKFVNKDRRDAYSYAKDPQIKQILNSERFEKEKSGIKLEEPKYVAPKQQQDEEDFLAQIMAIEAACAKSQKAQASTVSQKPQSIKPEPAKSQPVVRSEEAKINREEAENFGSEIEAIELAHQKKQEKIREAQRLISAQEEKERNERIEQARLTGAAVQKDTKPEVGSTPWSLTLELPVIQHSPEAQPRIRQEEKKQEAEGQQASEPSSGIVIEGGERPIRIVDPEDWYAPEE